MHRPGAWLALALSLGIVWRTREAPAADGPAPVWDAIALALSAPPPAPDQHKVTSIAAYGEMRTVLATPIPYRLAYRVSLPPGAVLELGYAVQPDILGESLFAVAEPTRFRVLLTEDDGTEHALVDRVVDIRERAEDRRWLDARVDLGAYAGRSLTLVITVALEADPARHSRPYALFSSPRIPRAPGPDDPNLLLVTIDALRADHVGAYGYGRPTTPALDRLAAEGLRFAHAYSDAPMTLPSLPQLFTSTVFPAPGQPTFVGPIAAAGVASAAIVNNVYLALWLADESRGACFDRVVAGDMDAAAITDRALAWIAAREGGRFALYLHYLDSHTPYHTPRPYSTMFRDPAYRGPIGETFGDVAGANDGARYGAADRQAIVALYDGAIRAIDDQLGRLLEDLRRRGLLDRTLVVVTADHGEELWDHGHFFHGQSLHDELLRVPLLAHLPGGARTSLVVERPVRAIDLAPGILEWLRLPRPVSFAGRSLAESVARPGVPPDDLVVTATVPQFPTRYGLRTPAFKLIETITTGRVQLFDLVHDPAEQRDVLADSPSEAATLAGRLADARAVLRRRGFQVRVVGPAGVAARFRLRLDGVAKGTGFATLDRTAGPADVTMAIAPSRRALKAKGRANAEGRGLRFDRRAGFFAADGSRDPVVIALEVEGVRASAEAVLLGANGHPAADGRFDARDPALVVDGSLPCPAPTAGVRACLWRAADTAAPTPATAPDAATRERLRALGYIE